MDISFLKELLMKKILLVVCMLTLAGMAQAAGPAKSFHGEGITNLPVGGGYRGIPQCGQFAEAEAVFSRQAGDMGRLVMRVCNNVQCAWPLKLNVTAEYDNK